MPNLEIRRRSGAVETKVLDRRSQLIIGAAETADVHIDAEGVLAVECRIIWNGQAYVVNTVNPDGVALNGTNVRKAELNELDVLRIGDVDVVYLAEEPRSGSAGGRGGQADLQMKPIGLDEAQDYSGSGISARSPQPTREGAGAERSERGGKPIERSATGRKGEERPARAARGNDAGESTRGEASRSEDDRHRKAMRDLLGDSDGEDEASFRKPSDRSAMPDRIAPDLSDVEESRPERGKPVLARGGGTVAPSAPRADALKGTIQWLFRPERRRPGEGELHRSPLVLGLTIGSLVLLLTGGTLWFVLSREFMNRSYDAAEAQLNAGQYEAAVESFTKYLSTYPSSGRAKEAQVNLGRAKVEQSLSGAIPDWEAGLKTLNEFINEHRDTKEFQPGDSALRTFARQSSERIALGATETARTAKRRPLLKIASDAQTLLELLSIDEKPTDRLAAISTSARTAEAAIVQHETFEAAVAKMKESIAAGQPLAALQAYRVLLDRYTASKTEKSIQNQVRAALEADRKLVQRQEGGSATGPTARGRTVDSELTLTRRVRSRTDVSSVGSTTIAVASGSLFGVDTITGEALWRRPLGNTPFHPVAVRSSSPGWLAYDELHRELVCLRERDGELLWKTSLPDHPTGAPLVHEGQVLIATRGSALCQFDLQTGEHQASLQFSQPVIGPPAISSAGDRMYLLGQESTLYILSRRPLACEKSVWLGHGAGVIRAPVLMLRDYLLLVENAGGDRSFVRLFDAGRDPLAPREIATSEMKGLVFDAPVVRGKQIVIPSSPERLTAFLVAETGDSQSLTRIAEEQVPGAKSGPIQVLLGPDDQFWMSSTALRRFDLKVDSIVPEKAQVAVGQTSQPLSAIGDTLFVGRRLGYSRAVLLAGADRQKMQLEWQTGLGAEVLEMTSPSKNDGATRVVTSLGDVYFLNLSRFAKGGIEVQPASTLAVDEKSTSPIGAVRLKDGRLAVWSGGETPRLWLVSNDAGPQERKLDLPLQVAPTELAEGLVLPLPGRLRLAGRKLNSPPVQEWTTPVQATSAPEWRGIAAFNENSLVALDADGRLTSVQLRSSPKPHLAEVSHWESRGPVDLPLAVSGDRAIVIGATGRVFALQMQSLDPVGGFDLPRPATRPAVVVGGKVLIDAGRETLYCLDARTQLNSLWQSPLGGAAVVGGLELNGRLVLARDDGRILTLNPETGEVVSTQDVGEPIAFGPRIWGERMVVGSQDGTLLGLPLQGGGLAQVGVAP